MIQFYALSVFANLIAGLALSANSEKAMGFVLAKDFAGEKTFRFSVGLLALVIGIFKLVSPIRGDVPVVGDLFPAVCGLILGTVMLIDFLRDSLELRSEIVEKIGKYTSRYRRVAGLAGIAAAVLHFLVPNVPII